FTSRTELYDLTVTACKCADAAEHLAALEPTKDNLLVWCRNIKMLAVHFFMIKRIVLRQTFCNRMRWIDNPQTLLLIGFTPLHIAASAHKLFEYFREMRGMQYN